MSKQSLCFNNLDSKLFYQKPTLRATERTTLPLGVQANSVLSQPSFVAILKRLLPKTIPKHGAKDETREINTGIVILNNLEIIRNLEFRRSAGSNNQKAVPAQRI